MTELVRKKIVVINGDVRYIHTNKHIHIGIEETNEKGIIWCQNCYKDKKPILSVSVDSISAMDFCLDCIKLLFSFKESGEK